MVPTEVNAQQIGDGPARNDDYMDLEVGGTHRAASGGRNPNAPTWDPGKMELRRMVDRLLALEERKVLTARPAEQAVPHKVKPPALWEKNVAPGFRLAEAVMEDNHARDPRVRRLRTFFLQYT